MYSPLIGQFAQRDPEGYTAGDANVYRYTGNGVLQATDPSGLAEGDEDKRRLLDALSKLSPSNEDSSDPFHGCVPRDWTSKQGTEFPATLLGLEKDDKGVAVLKLQGTGKNNKGTPMTAKASSLSKADQVFVEGLQAIPPNVTIDSLGKDPRAAWENCVVRDFGKLTELAKGREILKQVKASSNVKITIKPAKENEDSRIRRPLSGKEVCLYYNPNRLVGDQTADNITRERPPFMTLGTELLNAIRAPGTRTGWVPAPAPATFEYNPGLENRAKGDSEELRRQYNAVLKDGEKVGPLWDKYGKALPLGWGAAGVSESLKRVR
jgi:uncharacterized protein RhaS with RHS repeats